jgi:hypothetical protein
MAKALAGAMRESTDGSGFERAMKLKPRPNQVRNYKSYQSFASLWEDLRKRKVKDPKVLLDVYRLLNAYSAFRSATSAEYARKAVMCLIKDIKTVGTSVEVDEQLVECKGKHPL